MHNQPIVYEIERIRTGLERILHHLLAQIVVQHRKIVDVLAGVQRVRNTEAEREIERLQHSILIEMLFDHSKVVYRLVADREFDAAIVM